MPTISDQFLIRPASIEDLAKIRVWVADENKRGMPGNFLCNWGVIEAHFEDGRCLVYEELLSGELPGFLAGGVARDGILQVQYERRRQGIARRLVTSALEDCVSQDVHMIYIQCAPKTSLPFWQAMGFARIGESEFAHLTIPKDLTVPEDGSDVCVAINFYPETRMWKTDTAPLFMHSLVGRRNASGQVFLAGRIFFFQSVQCPTSDPVVEIVIENDTVYFSKAKYPEAAVVGVERGSEGFWVDKIDSSVDQVIEVR